MLLRVPLRKPLEMEDKLAAYVLLTSQSVCCIYSGERDSRLEKIERELPRSFSGSQH